MAAALRSSMITSQRSTRQTVNILRAMIQHIPTCEKKKSCGLARHYMNLVVFPPWSLSFEISLKLLTKRVRVAARTTARLKKDCCDEITMLDPSKDTLDTRPHTLSHLPWHRFSEVQRPWPSRHFGKLNCSRTYGNIIWFTCHILIAVHRPSRTLQVVTFSKLPSGFEEWAFANEYVTFPTSPHASGMSDDFEQILEARTRSLALRR
ncbi:hypothetical protein FN846DRAFT_950874 [Sphaerosporella brunnea]|uniref:Uncharacterized protein n=1 Tax=Sphaerosporella brunnea TaxID=1250544 RepID=A0A5J5EVB2_9PEZI|nr:hypothetical protein FN846DRAFT_950874 [Sphaerosporella brunnea]